MRDAIREAHRQRLWKTRVGAPITEEQLVPLGPRLHPARLALLLAARADPIVYRYALERRVEAAEVVGAGTSVAEQQLVAVHPRCKVACFALLVRVHIRQLVQLRIA
jgi:hypothetical protein